MQVNRNIVTISSLEQDPLEDTRFWLSKTPAERLIALELLRMRLVDYDNTTSRLQRFFEITVEINGIQINYLSLKDLRKNKQASGRYKDLDDLQHLPEE